MESFTQMQRFDKWLLFAFSVLVLMIIFGPMLSLGAVFVTMLNTFQANRAESAAVQSVLLGVTFIFETFEMRHELYTTIFDNRFLMAACFNMVLPVGLMSSFYICVGLFSGALITRFGPTMMILVGCVLVPLGFCISYFAKHIIYLYVSIGIISGVGNSLVFSSCIVVVERVFEGSQRLLCLAVLNTSTLVTAIFYPYFLKWLVEMYGLNGMFLILGGLSLNSFVLFTMCWTNRVTGQNDQVHSTTNTKKELDSIDRSRKSSNSLNDKMVNCFAKATELFNVPFGFVLIAGASSLASLDGYLGVMLDIAFWKGMTSSQGYTSFVMYYSFSAVSCIVAGLIKQKKGVNTLVYPILSALSGVCGQLLIIYTPKYFVYMIGTALTGMAFGGIIASSMNAAVQLVSQEHVPMAMGLLATGEGVLSVGAGPLYGSIRDMSASYKIVLVTVTCVQAIAAILFTMALITNRQRKRKIQQRSTGIFVTTRL